MTAFHRRSDRFTGDETGDDAPREAATAQLPGTITRLVAQARRPDRVSIFVEGSFAIGLPAEVVTQAGLVKGRVLHPQDLQALEQAADLHEAKRYALAALARKALTEAEMRRKLASRQHGPSAIDHVIDRLRSLGYVDDERYARAFASSRAAGRGFGRRRILAELRRRGVPEAVALAAVAIEEADRDPVAAAVEAAQKVWPRLEREADRRKRERRLFSYLARRGFDSDTIFAVLRRLAPDDSE